MHAQLTEKTVIVTGGGSGIGRAICKEFAQQGATVAVADINVEAARAVAKEIGSESRKAIAIEVDVADDLKVQAAVEAALQALERIDVLVNCAGVNSFATPDETTPDLWRRIRSVNLDGTWYCCRAVIGPMMRNRTGKIINIGSVAAIDAIPKAIPYTTSKHGIAGLTKALAVDLGPYNINVNCICPASVETPLLDKAVTKLFQEEIRKRIPLGRLGKPDDIAKAALFLASSSSDWITGVVLPVDGGLTCCLRSQHWE
jgi:NAD(P)-dependent dehydrogenase (short-subunit alcohol dehydrogenase family)